MRHTLNHIWADVQQFENHLARDHAFAGRHGGGEAVIASRQSGSTPPTYAGAGRLEGTKVGCRR
jgi:hypothetical protein